MSSYHAVDIGTVASEFVRVAVMECMLAAAVHSGTTSVSVVCRNYVEIILKWSSLISIECIKVPTSIEPFDMIMCEYELNDIYVKMVKFDEY
jgi:N-acyl-L-homoserine lactone synthetase